MKIGIIELNLTVKKWWNKFVQPNGFKRDKIDRSTIKKIIFWYFYSLVLNNFLCFNMLATGWVPGINQTLTLDKQP